MKSVRRYRIGILFIMIFMSVSFFGCGKKKSAPKSGTDVTSEKEKVSSLYGHDFIAHKELKYAEEYKIDYYDNGLTYIQIGEDKILLFDEGVEMPKEDMSGYIILQKPLNNIYMASSSSMDYFLYLNEIDKITMTSTKEEDWSVEEIKDLVKNEEIAYVGKYSAPDYEYLLDDGCSLAVENTMINHAPAAKEKIEQLGIPVIVERSSLENEPMGRLEWIKFYGILMDKEDEADSFFDEQVAKLNEIDNKIKNDLENNSELADKKISAACFYINASGIPAVRNPEDYMTKLVKTAGFDYSFESLTDNSNKTFTNLQMEEFFAGAIDTDVLIYSASFATPPKDMNELIGMDKLLADLNAVKNKNVWCYNIDIFQRPTKMAEIVEEFYEIYKYTAFGTEEPKTKYFYRLK